MSLAPKDRDVEFGFRNCKVAFHSQFERWSRSVLSTDHIVPALVAAELYNQLDRQFALWCRFEFLNKLGHVPDDVEGIYVQPNGTVYTNTGWDEGGRANSIFKNGQMASPDGSGVGGQAIVVTGNTVYASQDAGVTENPPALKADAASQFWMQPP